MQAQFVLVTVREMLARPAAVDNNVTGYMVKPTEPYDEDTFWVVPIEGTFGLLFSIEYEA